MSCVSASRRFLITFCFQFCSPTTAVACSSPLSRRTRAGRAPSSPLLRRARAPSRAFAPSRNGSSLSSARAASSWPTSDIGRMSFRVVRKFFTMARSHSLSWLDAEMSAPHCESWCAANESVCS